MKSKWVESDGKQILFIDLSKFQNNMAGFENELNLAISSVGQEMYQKPLHSVLVLVDLTDTNLTKTSNQLLSERITDTQKYVLRTAVVGMTGLRGIFLDYFARLAGSETVGFDNTDAAMKWLAATK
jgi:hypothetical protein